MMHSLLPLLASFLCQISLVQSPEFPSRYLGEWQSTASLDHRIEFRLEEEMLLFRQFPSSYSASSSAEWLPSSWQEGMLIVEDGNFVFQVVYLEGELNLRTLSHEGQVIGSTRFLPRLPQPQPNGDVFLANASNDYHTYAMGAIQGMPVGRAKGTASIFRVYLYRQTGERKEFVGSQALSHMDGFRFESLVDGNYLLVFSAQGPTGVQPNPPLRSVEILQGSVVEQNVELR